MGFDGIWDYEKHVKNFNFFSLQLRERYKVVRPPQKVEAIDELRNAFDLVEKSCPGITDKFVTDVVRNMGEQMLREAEVRRGVEKFKRYIDFSTC